MTPKEEAYQQIQAYLLKHQKRLELQTVEFIVWELQNYVPKSHLLDESDIRVAAVVWRTLHGPRYPLDPAKPASTSDSKAIAAVKSALTTVVEGVNLKHKDGKVNISVTGVTAELAKGDAKAAVGVSWGGTLSVEANKGSFYFTGQLASDKWEIKFSYPEDTSIPDLTKLGKVFSEGEKAMRGIIAATSSFKSLQDAARVKEAITPHIQPVSNAVDAAKSIAKAPEKGGVSVGVSVGSPDVMPGESGIPKGVQGQITLTVRF
jgi:hypothetical protein